MLRPYNLQGLTRKLICTPFKSRCPPFDRLKANGKAFAGRRKTVRAEPFDKLRTGLSKHERA